MVFQVFNFHELFLLNIMSHAIRGLLARSKLHPTTPPKMTLKTPSDGYDLVLQIAAIRMYVFDRRKSL